MLSHNSYPKNTPESQAMRKAFAYAGVLICLTVSIVTADIVVQGDLELVTEHQPPEIRTSFVQTKLSGSAFSSERAANDRRAYNSKEAAAAAAQYASNKPRP